VLRIDDVAWDDPLAQQLIAEVQQEYVVRYGGPDETVVDGAQFRPPYGAFVVAHDGAEAIGCGGLRRHDAGVVEVKRMFVRAVHRRKGYARALLRALESRARESGYARVVLETGLAQPEAIALYEGEGYRPIAGFGHYAAEPLSRSFAKDL